MTKHKRSRYVLDIRTQAPFILKVCSIWAGGIILLCLLLYYLADEELGRSFYSIHLRLRNTWQILLPAVIISSGISFLVTMGVTFCLALRESHRLWGPTFKFHRLFHQLQEGYFDADFSFRKGDLLQEIGESYRAALKANADRILSLQELTKKAEWKTTDLREKLLPRSMTEDEKALLDEVARLASLIRESAAVFHTGTP